MKPRYSSNSSIIKYLLTTVLAGSLSLSAHADFGELVSEAIEDPGLLASYCEERYGGLPQTSKMDKYATAILKSRSESQEISAKTLQIMCKELRLLAGFSAQSMAVDREEVGREGSTPAELSTHGGGDCGQLRVEHNGPVNGEIRALAGDVANVVAFLEKDRREANGSRTEREVFRLADGLFEQQLAVFNDVNGLSPRADREDNFLIRTVKDVDLDEEEFKRRSIIMKIILDQVIDHYQRTGSWKTPTTVSLHRVLDQAGFRAKAGEIPDALSNLRKIKERMDENWKISNAMPPAGSSRDMGNVIAKLRNIRNTAAKALDDEQQLEADEFYYYSYFIASRKQQSTLFVQPETGGDYVPFKRSREIGFGPRLSQAAGSKLVQGDKKQPEGFLKASWGAASDNVYSGYGKWMYYRAHVNYGADESESERDVLRRQLRASGLGGGRGGAIRIHADVGSTGCLELPIEDSVAVTGLARSGNDPTMQTIPFPFTPENLEYFGNKVKGHGEFWRQIAEEESDKFSYSPAVSIDEVIESAQDEFN